MLVLSRKEKESIVINGNIKIVVTAIQNGRVRLGIEAPQDLPILRQEVENGLKRDTTEAAVGGRIMPAAIASAILDSGED